MDSVSLRLTASAPDAMLNPEAVWPWAALATVVPLMGLWRSVDDATSQPEPEELVGQRGGGLHGIGAGADWV